MPMARAPDPLRDELVEKLKVLSIADGDLIMLSLAPNTFMTDRAARAINAWLKDTGRENVRVLDIGPGGDAIAVTDEVEEELARLGFYKHPGCDVCGMHPAPYEKVRVEEAPADVPGALVTIRHYCQGHK